MKNKIKSAFTYLFKAHFGRIILGALLFVFGGSLSHNGLLDVVPNISIDPFFWVMMIGLAIVGFEAFLLFLYGWILNPYKKLKEKWNK